MESIGETQIAVTVWLQTVGIVAGVIHVLLADELGDKTDVEILERSEGKIVTQNDVWGEGNGRVTEMLLNLPAIVPVVDIVHIINDFVDAETAVDMPGEKSHGLVTYGKLDAGTVTFLHIGHQRIAGLV